MVHFIQLPSCPFIFCIICCILFLLSTPSFLCLFFCQIVLFFLSVLFIYLPWGSEFILDLIYQKNAFTALKYSHLQTPRLLFQLGKNSAVHFVKAWKNPYPAYCASGCAHLWHPLSALHFVLNAQLLYCGFWVVVKSCGGQPCRLEQDNLSRAGCQPVITEPRF